MNIRLVIFLYMAMSYPLLAADIDLGEAFQFPDSKLIRHVASEPKDYQLSLGAYKNFGGYFEPDKSQRIKGDLSRYTFRLPKDRTLKEIVTYYESVFAGVNARSLFNCKGLACGPSHRWANDNFSVRELYGPDKNQRYHVFYVPTQLQSKIYALYVIRRGNQRVYVQMDVLSIDKEQEELFTKAQGVSPVLAEKNISIGVSLEVDQDIRIVDYVKSKLQEKATLRILLVGHFSDRQRSIDEQIKMAKDYASGWQAYLLTQGIPSERMSVYGIGPLAPANGKEDRVELLFY